ncbi:hypothetical protein WJX84_001007 [Apatococcus fuscideae]|uniref:Uncharacterized protein n=1 Tax=Apatococcus fuscideae TaxID=2026836 RepID=A0AAW1SPI4_9CHLO
MTGTWLGDTASFIAQLKWYCHPKPPSAIRHRTCQRMPLHAFWDAEESWTAEENERSQISTNSNTQRSGESGRRGGSEIHKTRVVTDSSSSGFLARRRAQGLQSRHHRQPKQHSSFKKSLLRQQRPKHWKV